MRSRGSRARGRTSLGRLPRRPQPRLSSRRRCAPRSNACARASRSCRPTSPHPRPGSPTTRWNTTRRAWPRCCSSPQGALHIARPPWSPTSPNQGGAPLHARLRYFDPVRRRAGLPEDVAALVDKLEADRTGVTLVNLNSKPRTRRHRSGWRLWRTRDRRRLTTGTRLTPSNGRSFDVKLAPGCGAHLTLDDAALLGESDSGLSLGLVELVS